MSDHSSKPCVAGASQFYRRDFCSLADILTAEILAVACPACGALKGDGCSHAATGNYIAPHSERIAAGLRARTAKQL